jgi:hypothetical protein
MQLNMEQPMRKQLNMEQPMRNARVRQFALGQLHLDRRTKEDPDTNNRTQHSSNRCP